VRTLLIKKYSKYNKKDETILE